MLSVVSNNLSFLSSHLVPTLFKYSVIGIITDWYSALVTSEVVYPRVVITVYFSITITILGVSGHIVEYCACCTMWIHCTGFICLRSLPGGAQKNRCTGIHPVLPANEKRSTQTSIAANSEVACCCRITNTAKAGLSEFRQYCVTAMWAFVEQGAGRKGGSGEEDRYRDTEASVSVHDFH